MAVSRRRMGVVVRNTTDDFSLPPNTKDFMQKFCYKKQASVDMTQYGFINDSKLQHLNLLLKPLRNQIKKICGSPCTKNQRLLRSNTFKLKMEPRDMKPNRKKETRIKI